MWNRLFSPLIYIVSPFHHLLSKLSCKCSIDSTHAACISSPMLYCILCIFSFALQHGVQQYKEFFYYLIGIVFSCMQISALCCTITCCLQHYYHRQGFPKLRLRFFRAIESSGGCTQIKSSIADTKLKWLLALSYAASCIHSREFSREFHLGPKRQYTVERRFKRHR